MIGGQASGVSKTGVVCALIAAMPERRWTAIKITQCSHHAPAEGRSRARTSCLTHTERDAANATDSSRYLAAGAERSLWVRVRPCHLAEAMPRIHDKVVRAESVVLESNSVVEFLNPDLYVLILSPSRADFKASAARTLDRADAILLPASLSADTPASPGVVRDRIERVPRFEIAPQGCISREFLAFVAQKLDGAAAR